MARMAAFDPRPWGARPVVVPCVALVVLIALGRLINSFVHVEDYALALTLTVVFEVVLYGALGLAVWWGGRDVARRYAGWRWAFGIQRLRPIDAAWIAAGAGMVLVGRLVIGVVLVALNRADALQQARNLTVSRPSVGLYIVLAVLVVVAAPVIEEIVFRGLLLRTFMRRSGFWPAALASSAIFAVFHSYEVRTLSGAVVLVLVVFVLGLSNCLLVRWSGRVTPGMVVHAGFNALALGVLIASSS